MSGAGMGISERIAAVDLGSNSFRLLLAERCGSDWQPLLRVEERVRLAEGLRDGGLSFAAIERGLSALRELARHLRGLPPQALRVVATHSLRAAQNADYFIGPGSHILDHPIEVIDGDEEARLAYLGAVGQADGSQLVIDIGGGSTEIALGEGIRLQHVASLSLGCLTLQHHFRDGFRDGAITREGFAALQREMSEEIRQRWRWPLPAHTTVRGSSGVWLALDQVLCRQGLTGGITSQALCDLREQLLRFDRVEAIRFDGLTDARRHLFAGGLAIALALFDALGLRRVTPVNGALLEGVVSTLVAAPRGVRAVN